VHALAGRLVKYANVVKLFDVAHVLILIAVIWASFLLLLYVDYFLGNFGVISEIHGLGFFFPLKIVELKEALMSSLVSFFVAYLILRHYGNQFVSLVDLIVLLIDILNFQA
jgi:hypothetical protein